MSLLDGVRLTHKLAILVAIPLSGAAYFASNVAIAKHRQSADAQQIVELAEMARHVGDLLHGTQVERGLSAVVLSSGGADGRAALADQRVEVDSRLAALSVFLESHSVSDAGLAPIRRGIEALERRGAIRAKTDRLDGEGVISFYIEANRELLRGIEAIDSQISDPELVRWVGAYAAWVGGKERLGIERAVLASALNRGDTSLPAVRRVSSLIAERAALFEFFSGLASREVMDTFEQLESGPEFRRVGEIEQEFFAAASGTGSIATSGAEWFRAMTAEIVLAKELEDLQADLIRDRARTVRDSAAVVFRLTLAMSALMIAAVVVLAFLVLRSVTRPVGTLRNAALSIADGDASTSVDHASGDELGELADAFRRMVRYFHDLTEASHAVAAGDLTVNVAVRSERDTLGASFNTMLANLRGTVEKLRGTAGQVASSSEEFTSVSTSLSVTAEQTLAQAQAVAAAAEEMGASIFEISRSMTDTTAVARNAVDSTEAATASMSRLNNASEEIGRIIGVIRTIAEQTNLLALNATIEAARAGESGKGFAVVAGEVKELASQTGTATEEISRTVQAIQSEIGDAVHVIDKVTEIISQINEHAVTVASSVEEQSVTTGTISENVTGVAEAARTTATATTQTSASAAELAKLAQDMAEMTRQFSL